MMRMTISCTALVILLGAPAVAASKYVTIYGASTVDKPFIGREYESDLYRQQCMATQPGWTVGAVGSLSNPKSKQPAPPNPLNDALGGMLGDRFQLPDGSALTAEQRAAAAKNPDSMREEIISKAVAAYEKSIQDMTKELKPGDQVLLDFFAHGMSNCPVQVSSRNMGAPIKNYENCDHKMRLSLPGNPDLNPLVPTKRLVGAIKKLIDERGLKVAVNLRSCFSGAAMKDFGEAGVCAFSSTTPDTTTYACVDETSRDLDASSMVQTFGDIYCKGKKTKDIIGKIPPAARSEAGEKCFKNASAQAEESLIGLPPNPSISELTAAERKRDQTRNQPLGTDGPFWLAGNMGFLGDAVQQVDAQKFGDCIKNSTEFIASLAEQIDVISKKRGCSFKNAITQAAAPYKNMLAVHYSNYRSLFGTTVRQDSIVDEGIAGGKDAKLAMLEEMGKIISANGPPAGAPDALPPPAMLKDMLQKYPYDSARQFLHDYPDFKGEFPGNAPEKKALIEKYFGGPEGVTKFLKKFSVLREDIAEKKAKFKSSGDAIVPAERAIYRTLQKSPEYTSCLAKNPALKKAKESCEQFKMPDPG
ncbi:MAG: hypothetical protein HY074_10150 [Deltaproteobacteria bacterium]|nr:hypothetical protein [Deltaproteobacteria bacterium]